MKVMTLNIQQYGTRHGPWPARRQLIRQVVQTADPDVIALQAVRSDPAWHGGLDQAAQLAERVPGYGHVVFEPAMEHAGGILEGPALLSRLGIAETDALKLSLRPGLEDTHRRLVLHARLDLPGNGEPLHLFNAHFSWVSEQAQDNIAEALPFLNRFTGRGLLVGDLNTPPDSRLFEPLRAAGWQDVWDMLRPAESGYTFESDRPSLRIDYAWANAALRAEVRSIERVADVQDANGARPSDHLGLLVGLALP